ncbi:MAG: lysine-2,3-aminomutase-like protein [Alphaproteobacteria bacterium]|nr:lysine-2,3-aminomutase-like protein [Alphaproteobacteria bacterium]
MTKTAARSLDDLARAGILPAVTPELQAVAGKFAVSVTPALMNLINPDDPNDPIAAQFVPRAEELAVHPDEITDPIGDHAFSPVKGIVHRYPDRVLMKLLHACPAYCRFCFRSEQLGGPGGTLAGEDLENALRYIEQHPEIWEVILTGGDPLMLPDRHLAKIAVRLNAIPHVKILRVHTRIPLTNPSRITDDLIASLRGRLPVYVLLHCNHARELSHETRAACARLVDAGMPMLSQSVLLRGVNDTPAALEELMRALVESRVKPYYLHHADLARGTSHFHVPVKEGQALMRTLRGRVSGLCQPQYVLDIPGGHGKAPLGPAYAERDGKEWQVEDYKGTTHTYKDRS